MALLILFRSPRVTVGGLMSVLPAHRGRGVGGLLMAWGNSFADERNCQCWMEATETGKRLYERWGYSVLFKVCVEASKDDAGLLWRKLQREMTPEPFYAMWRPGKSESGNTLPKSLRDSAGTVE